jgi:hypothetical protein
VPVGPGIELAWLALGHVWAAVPLHLPSGVNARAHHAQVSHHRLAGRHPVKHRLQKHRSYETALDFLALPSQR